MRILRLFSILDRLRVNRHPVSATHLANELGVSVRTIYRDMATLQSMGAPVRGEGGVGYQMEKGYFLPPLHFDADELDAIILGMQLIMAYGDGKLVDAAIRATSKISASLLEKDKDKIAKSPLKVYADPTVKALASPFLDPLRHALHDRMRVLITYQDAQSETSIRTIRPLGLALIDKIWLLTAWCEKRSDFRNFRADRIVSLKPTGAPFPREKGREYSDFLKTL